MAMGTLLPWITFNLSVSRNGFQLGSGDSLTADGPIVLGLGVVSVVIGVAALTRSNMPRVFQRSSIVTGIGVGTTLIADWSGIHNIVNQVSAEGVTASIGYGYWVCGVGALLAVIGGIALHVANGHERI
jgi:hypothetical protein